MVGDFIEMTTATGGTGALTLSAVTGSPGYADLFGASGTRFVEYAIDEFTDATRSQLAQSEAGIGALTLSTLSLARSKIEATWNGTTYVTASPSAITFGTTAANIRVVCAPLAGLPAFAVPWMQGAVGDAIGVSSFHHFNATGTMAVVANTEYYVPFLHCGTPDVVQASIVVTTAVGSTNCKAAMYELGTDGQPAVKLFDIASGTPLSTGTTGNKSATIAAYLPPGWYYFGLIFSGAPTLRAPTQMWSTPGGTSSGSNAWCLSGSGSYTTGLPAPRATALAINTTNCPSVYVKARN